MSQTSLLSRGRWVENGLDTGVDNIVEDLEGDILQKDA